MSPDGPSNIRVFIHWEDQTVFAGEELKCRIVFKNVASVNQNSRTSNPTSSQSTPAVRHASPLVGSSRGTPNTGLAPPSARRGHRSTLSLDVSANSQRGATIPQWTPPQLPPSRSNHSHKRSLSIVSIGSAVGSEDKPNGNASPGRQQQRPVRGHGRSSSLQISPRSVPLSGPQSAPFGRRGVGSDSSPLFNHNSFPPNRQGFGRPGAATAPTTPGLGLYHAPRNGAAGPPDFKFPMSPQSDAGNSPTNDHGDFLPTPASATGETPNLPIRSKGQVPIINEHSAPVARILSSTSIAGGTPRSSGEFYSMSNNSSETLASEYVTQPLRNGLRPPHLRRSSGFAPTSASRLPELLMMGYAQIQGSFMLDGSLINLAPFEQIKRKAAVGGQGGGVIGVETSKRDSGLLRSFGWGSLSNSIGELLGGGELSSMKDMRSVASSKSIPLLSTPQSILFVDLQLAPGESKTYEYSFRMPKGLPPSHRGKAMKITYSLVIGTQRPGGSREQQIRSIEVPFRVLGSVNSHGEILGHDLMSPYIILRDLAKVQAVSKAPSNADLPTKVPSKPAAGNTLNSFLSYVEELLDRPRNGQGLLSPTAGGPSSRRTSIFEEASTAKEAIDLAILRSNLSSQETGQSSNRFEIARNGQKVGVVMLTRPSYRLGEVINMVIDFSNAETPCYAVHCALETAERIEPTLALRSEASVHRVTRKVYCSSSEAALFARRVVFNPTIPISATPELITSGVSLEWKIRIEFVVRASPPPANGEEDGEGEEEEEETNKEEPHSLLEPLSRDSRGGLVLVAAEYLDCESFEVAVPLRVYGAVCNGLERLERDEAEIGLVV